MDFLTLMIVLALLATIGALGMGVFSMVHGGQYDREHAQQFMTARVGLQGVTLLFLVLALLMG